MIAKNTLLEDITREFAVLKPDFEEIQKLFQRKPLFRESRYDESKLAQCISELILYNNVKKISSKYPGRVKFDQISPGTLTDDYWFRLNPLTENIEIHQRMDYGYESIGDFDLLTIVDGLVTLWEIKLRNYEVGSRTASLGVSKITGKQRKRKDYGDRVSHPTSMGASYAMTAERTHQLLRPLQKYFKTDDCGYVLVISSDQIDPTKPEQAEFMQNNGILVPFYTDKFTFRQDLHKFQKEAWQLTKNR